MTNSIDHIVKNEAKFYRTRIATIITKKKEVKNENPQRTYSKLQQKVDGTAGVNTSLDFAG